MDTLRLYADPANLATHDDAGDRDIHIAAGIVRNGGTVAFATETVYGLGANAFDGAAVAKIFEAKQRPGWDPLIVHIADDAMLREIVSVVPEAAQVLMEHFWPGPLTLLMPRSARIGDAVTAGRSTVGVRMPAHPVARALIRAAGVPIAAPSANMFGHTSPTTAAHVAADLNGRIDAILDSGPTLHGVESAVLDVAVDPCVLYRPGAISLEQLHAVWPAIVVYGEPATARGDTGDAAGIRALPSPGVGIRHYAPHARLVLVEAAEDALASSLGESVRQALHASAAVGVLLPGGAGFNELRAVLEAKCILYAWGEWAEPETLARHLFAGLRALDDAGVQVILCPLPGTRGVGLAVRDRLSKAARAE